MATSEAAPKESTVFFTSGAHTYTARDAIHAAAFRGELEPHWNEVVRLAACEQHAAEHELEMEESALDTSSNTFRYQHDLITAEETEQWLDRRGLTLPDFADFFARHYWGDSLRGKVAFEPVPYLPAPAELQELLISELVLTDELDRMAERLAWRIAALEASLDEELTAEQLANERAEFLQRDGLTDETVTDWLENFGRDEHWLQQMCRGEALYRRECDAKLTLAERKRELADLRLPLTKFEVEMIELESLNAAREAFLCVREDGMSMEEIAHEGKYPFRRSARLLEEIPLEFQQRFLSVSPGDLLEPIERDGGYQLYRVLGKAEPDVADPAVRERADHRILGRHFSELAARHLEWRLLTIQHE